MPKRLIVDDLKYLLFIEVYQSLQSPKGQRKAFSLIEAAIQCIARKGFDGVTLEMIAREAAVTRPLLKHYFNDLEDIKLTSLKYIRLLFQKLTIEAMEKKATPSEMLKAYVEGCLHWTVQQRTHAVVWFSFMHLSGRDKKQRALNTKAVSVGTNRIEALLKLGVSKGNFRCRDTNLAARMIQILITGAVVSSVSEDITNLDELTKALVSQCLSVAVS